MMARRLKAWLAWSAAYFVVSLTVAFLAHGMDMDQLTSRSAVSRVAASVDRILWGPYHWFSPQLAPSPTQMHLTTPLLLVANTLAWGALLATVAPLFARLRQRR